MASQRIEIELPVDLAQTIAEAMRKVVVGANFTPQDYDFAGVVQLKQVVITGIDVDYQSPFFRSIPRTVKVRVTFRSAYIDSLGHQGDQHA